MYELFFIIIIAGALNLLIVDYRQKWIPTAPSWDLPWYVSRTRYTIRNIIEHVQTYIINVLAI